MDMRSWPWKKKSSEKTRIEKALSSLESSAASAVSQGNQNQDNYKKPNYVQISLESYSQLTGLEDQVKAYEDQVKTYEDKLKIYEDQVQTYEAQVKMNEDQLTTYEDQIKALEDEVKEVSENLCEAQTEILNQEALVKQHSKVAEDAVSGWEKAETESLTLKSHLESVSLLKLAAEDRVSELDDALRECFDQVRDLEEHQQELHEVIRTKSKQCDKIKLELEAKVGNLTQELYRSAAENDTISRSLQERSNMLFKVSEEKTRAEAEIELLKSNLESAGREINSLKYELHVVTKEMEIRNEEKNMSVKSAEVANKQHLEGVKKIAKLEAECQRLRGLVRKKLPGPAALAQMKLEVESLDRDYESPKKSPVKSLEFTLDGIQKSQKENEFLTKRLLAMEEETKMLKEALSKRNSELLASRNYCAQTVNKLRNLEAQLEADNQQKSTLTSNFQASIEGSPSLTSISEDGNDDEISRTTSEASPSKKAENEIMDDFLEMEKLACVSNESVIAKSKELEKKSLDGVIKEISAFGNNKTSSEIVDMITEELRSAISSIYDYVKILENEATSNQYSAPDKDEIVQNIKGFYASFEKFMGRETGLTGIVLDLSHVLNKAREFKFDMVSCKNNEDEINGSDCIDKVALPEDKDVHETKVAIDANCCAHSSCCTSHPNIPHQGSCFSVKEFECLKVEKDNAVLDLARCLENLESTKQVLEEVKSELASAQKSNSLAETQLKCMVESYNTLETRAENLQTELNLLRAKIESLQDELQDERRFHQDALAKCADLEEQLQRKERCDVADDADVKPNQERELAAATEKLAECQETIFLLGKQLKSWRSESELNELAHSKRIQKGEFLMKGRTNRNGKNSLDFDQIESEISSNEAPVEIFNSTFSPANTEPNSPVSSPIKPKHQKHRHTKSGSSSSSSGPTPEKSSRGFTRFFSGKGENGC